MATHEHFPEGWVSAIRRALACGGHGCPLDGVLCPLTRWQARDTQCCLQQGRHGAVLATGRYLLLVPIRSSPPGPGPSHASVHTTPDLVIAVRLAKAFSLLSTSQEPAFNSVRVLCCFPILYFTHFLSGLYVSISSVGSGFSVLFCGFLQRS